MVLDNIVGPPARGEDFFDREELVDLLWRRLLTGNVLLPAPRRFGKTSVMFRLIDEPRPGWKVVHLDAEAIGEPVNFVIELLNALMADRHIRSFLVSAWKRSCRWLRGLLEEVELAGPWELGMKLRLKDKVGPQWQERGQALLEALRAYTRDHPLLVIIDELPVMLSLFHDNKVSHGETRAFLYWFRKLRTDPQVGLTECRFLVGGSIGIEHQLSRFNASDSFNDFERIALGELSAEQAADLVRRLLESRGVDLSRATRRQMLDLIGATVPFFIQVFVAEVANALNSHTGRIGPKAVEGIYHDRVMPACRTYFQHYYDRLRYYDKPEEQAAKAMLRTMAIAMPQPVQGGQLHRLYRDATGRARPDDDFARMLAELENDFYIAYLPEAGGYTFRSKILCDWWRRYYAL